jgi:16S rRNA (cytosine967-C5)-methyltransferase
VAAQPAAQASTRSDRRAELAARALAWDILQQVEAGGYADALLGSRLPSSTLPARDQALVTRLVYGTIAWQRYLDHILAAFCRRALADLDPPVRAVLRLALYQTCILTRIPRFAAVDTSVSLIKRYRGGMAAGFVNAVLRRATAQWQGVPLPARHADLAGHLSVRYSHPRWLVERWLALLGEEETGALLQANNEPAATALRINPRRSSRAALLDRLRAAGIAAHPGHHSPQAVIVEGVAPETLPGFAEGCFSVQGEASQLIGFLAAPKRGQRWLDACAAPGGKATHLAELMDNDGEIVALDIHAPGLDRLNKTAARLGLTCIRTEVGDAASWKDSGDGFDGILIDAPCSGLGTLRQHPEIRWRRTPADIADLSVLQERIVSNLAPCLRPGGVLLYSTCTLTDEENDSLVRRILDNHPSFTIDDPRHDLPPDAQGLIAADAALRTYPHRQGLDGFFAVRLRRSTTRG